MPTRPPELFWPSSPEAEAAPCHSVFAVVEIDQPGFGSHYRCAADHHIAGTVILDVDIQGSVGTENLVVI